MWNDCLCQIYSFTSESGCLKVNNAAMISGSTIPQRDSSSEFMANMAQFFSRSKTRQTKPDKKAETIEQLNTKSKKNDVKKKFWKSTRKNKHAERAVTIASVKQGNSSSIVTSKIHEFPTGQLEMHRVSRLNPPEEQNRSSSGPVQGKARSMSCGMLHMSDRARLEKYVPCMPSCLAIKSNDPRCEDAGTANQEKTTTSFNLASTPMAEMPSSRSECILPKRDVYESLRLHTTIGQLLHGIDTCLNTIAESKASVAKLAERDSTLCPAKVVRVDSVSYASSDTEVED